MTLLSRCLGRKSFFYVNRPDHRLNRLRFDYNLDYCRSSLWAKRINAEWCLGPNRSTINVLFLFCWSPAWGGFLSASSIQASQSPPLPPTVTFWTETIYESNITILPAAQDHVLVQSVHAEERLFIDAPLSVCRWERERERERARINDLCAALHCNTTLFKTFEIA